MDPEELLIAILVFGLILLFIYVRYRVKKHQAVKSAKEELGWYKKYIGLIPERISAGQTFSQLSTEFQLEHKKISKIGAHQFIIWTLIDYYRFHNPFNQEKSILLPETFWDIPFPTDIRKQIQSLDLKQNVLYCGYLTRLEDKKAKQETLIIISTSHIYFIPYSLGEQFKRVLHNEEIGQLWEAFIDFACIGNIILKNAHKIYDSLDKSNQFFSNTIKDDTLYKYDEYRVVVALLTDVKHINIKKDKAGPYLRANIWPFSDADAFIITISFIYDSVLQNLEFLEIGTTTEFRDKYQLVSGTELLIHILAGQLLCGYYHQSINDGNISAEIKAFCSFENIPMPNFRTA